MLLFFIIYVHVYEVSVMFTFSSEDRGIKMLSLVLISNILKIIFPLVPFPGVL